MVSVQTNVDEDAMAICTEVMKGKQFFAILTMDGSQIKLKAKSEANVKEDDHKGNHWEEFIKHFDDDTTVQFAVVSLRYSTDEQPPRKVTKSFLIKYVPSKAKVAQKMESSVSFQSLKGKLKTQKTLEAFDKSDLAYDNVVGKC